MSQHFAYRKNGRLWLPAAALSIAIPIVLIFFEASFFIRQYGSNSGAVFKSGGASGGDFISLYTAGSLFKASPASVYDFTSQRALQGEHFAGTPSENLFAPFFYPPPIAALMSLFSEMDFYTAFLLFAGLSFVAGSIAIICVASSLKISILWKLALILNGVAFVPFALDTIAGGQISTIGMVIAAGMYLALRGGKPILAGLILSLGYYKPPLFLFLSLSIIALREWRVLLGGLIGGATWIVITLLLIGAKNTFSYYKSAISYRAGSEVLPQIAVDSNQGVGLFALLTNKLPGGGFLAEFFLLAAILILFYWVYRKETKLIDAFPIILALSSFLSVQVVRYDLALFIVPALIASGLSIQDSRSFPPILILSASIWIDMERFFRGSRGDGIILAAAFFVLAMLYEHITRPNTPPYTAQEASAS